MILSLFPFLVVIAFFLMLKEKRDALLPFLFVLFYIALFFFITASTHPKSAIPGSYIGESLGLKGRVLVHGLFFSILVLLVFKERGGNLIEWKTFLSFALIPLFMGISTIYAGNYDELYRAILLVVYYINIFLVLRFSDYQKELIINSYILLALCLGVVSILTIMIYGNYPDWTNRLGRPWNARVLSAALTIAIIFCSGKSKIGTLILFCMILATGSRLSIAFGLLALARGFYEYRNIIIICLIFISPILGYFIVDEIRNFSVDIFDRSDITSGRLTSWLKAIEMLPDVWVWGVGERFEIDLGGGEMIRLHNAIFESLISYGIFYMVALATTYIFVFRSQVHAWQKFLVLYIFAELLFGTLTWTNLGDPISLVGLVVLLPSVDKNYIMLNKVNLAKS